MALRRERALWDMPLGGALGPHVARMWEAQDDEDRAAIARVVAIEADRQERLAASARLARVGFPAPDLASKAHVSPFAASDLMVAQAASTPEGADRLAYDTRLRAFEHVVEGLVADTADEGFWVRALGRVPHEMYRMADHCTRPFSAALWDSEPAPPRHYARGIAAREDARRRLFLYLLSREAAHRWDAHLADLLNEAQGLRRIVPPQGPRPLSARSFLADA